MNAVTTGRDGGPGLERDARALAERFGLTFVPRSGRSIEALDDATGGAGIAVFGAGGLTLWRAGVKLAFSAGMAELRVKRVRAGLHEPLVALGELGPGDEVLDATLGLARDALVMAASGAQVQGLEAVPMLAAFCEAGLRAVGGAAGEVADRVRVRSAPHAQVLAEMPAQSVDVVYLDPMFGDAVAMPPEYALFRTLADPAPLTPAVLAQARRVARRSVIVKDGPRGNLVKRLGVPLRALTFGNRVRYARVDPA